MGWFGFAPGPMLINVKPCFPNKLSLYKILFDFFFDFFSHVSCSNPLIICRWIYITLDKYFSFGFALSVFLRNLNSFGFCVIY